MTGTDIGLHVGNLYSKALYDLAAEFGIVEEVKDELTMLETLIGQEKEFLHIMSSPQFTDEYKQSLLNKMFAGQISDLALNFLLTVDRHNRTMYLPQMITSFGELWDAHHGISIVELTLHENINPDELAGVTQAISNAMGKQVQLKLKVKPAIMGGAVIRYGESVIDNSIKARLYRAVHTIMDSCKQIRIKDEVQYQ
ncbi:MAG: ATP synthase F1 subunit delta [Sedimentisphaerales bacterium]|jgi:F-type H+-transporting ATPase subunit delta